MSELPESHQITDLEMFLQLPTTLTMEPRCRSGQEQKTVLWKEQLPNDTAESQVVWQGCEGMSQEAGSTGRGKKPNAVGMPCIIIFNSLTTVK
jgi:hypothetical protein